MNKNLYYFVIYIITIAFCLFGLRSLIKIYKFKDNAISTFKIIDFSCNSFQNVEKDFWSFIIGNQCRQCHPIIANKEILSNKINSAIDNAILINKDSMILKDLKSLSLEQKTNIILKTIRFLSPAFCVIKKINVNVIQIDFVLSIKNNLIITLELSKKNELFGISDIIGLEKMLVYLFK